MSEPERDQFTSDYTYWLATGRWASDGELHDVPPMSNRQPSPLHKSNEHAPRRKGMRREPHEIPLNEWQVELLQELSNGYSTKQIAEKHYMTTSGVRTSLSVIKKKLKARTPTEAACNAIRQKIIT